MVIFSTIFFRSRRCIEDCTLIEELQRQDVGCLSFTSLRWTLAPVLMGWQNLAKLSLCLADQYSSTSMSIYDNDQYSLGQWWSVCLWWWWWWWQWWWPKNWGAPSPPPGTAHPPPRTSSAHYWWQHLLQDSLPPRAQRADLKPRDLPGKADKFSEIFLQPKPEYKRSHYFAMLPRIPPPYSRQWLTFFLGTSTNLFKELYRILRQDKVDLV